VSAGPAILVAVALEGAKVVALVVAGILLLTG
jgi:hypothetical protein